MQCSTTRRCSWSKRGKDSWWGATQKTAASVLISDLLTHIMGLHWLTYSSEVLVCRTSGHCRLLRVLGVMVLPKIPTSSAAYQRPLLRFIGLRLNLLWPLRQNSCCYENFTDHITLRALGQTPNHVVLSVTFNCAVKNWIRCTLWHHAGA